MHYGGFHTGGATAESLLDITVLQRGHVYHGFPTGRKRAHCGLARHLREHGAHGTNRNPGGYPNKHPYGYPDFAFADADGDVDTYAVPLSIANPNSHANRHAYANAYAKLARSLCRYSLLIAHPTCPEDQWVNL